MGCSQGSPQVVSSQKQKVVAVQKRSFYDDYTLGKKLGAGAFAQVRTATPKDCSDELEECAVKIIDLRATKDSKASHDGGENVNQLVRMDAKCEAAVWRRVSESRNPYCVKLLEVFWDSTCCYMVMEKCDGTLLYELEHNELNEPYLASLFKQMVRATAGLHSVSVVHRDIKPDNFLVNRGGHVKLGDFGLSAVQQAGKVLTEVYGTAPFMSPEMLRDARYGEKTDVWSVGVLMYVLMYGQFPYYAQEKSSKAMKLAIRDGAMTPSFKPWKSLNDAIRPTSALETLIRNMIHREPARRFTSMEALEDPFWQQLERTARYYSDPPSLRPMLQGAIRAGAFTVPRRNKEETKDATDLLLSELSRRSGYNARRNSLTSANSMQSRQSSIQTAGWNAQGPQKGGMFASNSNCSAAGSGHSGAGSLQGSPHRKTAAGRREFFDSSSQVTSAASTATGGNSDQLTGAGTMNTINNSLHRTGKSAGSRAG